MNQATSILSLSITMNWKCEQSVGITTIARHAVSAILTVPFQASTSIGLYKLLIEVASPITESH